MLKWLKIALVAVAGFLLLVVILQNTDPVVTRILSAEVEMPRAVFLFVLLASGFVLGYATCLWQRRRRKVGPGAPSDAPTEGAEVAADEPDVSATPGA